LLHLIALPPRRLLLLASATVLQRAVVCEAWCVSHETEIWFRRSNSNRAGVQQGPTWLLNQQVLMMAFQKTQ
jgi:hypothetical protein